MNAKEAVLSRRSCRKYLPKDIPKEIVEDLILAGRSASTGMNLQKLKFNIIYNNVKKIQDLGEEVLKKLDENLQKRYYDRKKLMDLTNPIFYDAPCLIVITCDKSDYKTILEIDTGLATGNICIMANYYGISCVPVACAKMGNEEAVLNAIGTSKDKDELLLCIPFGYEHPDWKAKYLPKKELISKVNWIE